MFFEYLERCGARDRFAEILPDKKTSPNQIAGLDILNSLFACVLMGGNRYAHAEQVRYDLVLQTIMGSLRSAGADTLRRYFDSWTEQEGDTVYRASQELCWQMLIRRFSGDVLDLDSTNLERYGRLQEGVKKGYHGTKAKQRMHTPLLGMLAKAKHIVHVELRPGGASTLTGVDAFMEELLARVPAEFRIQAVRADAGFHAEGLVRKLEEKGLAYVIAARMHPPLKRLAASVSMTQWQKLDHEHEIADIQHREPGWQKERRLLLIRRVIQEKNPLFESTRYEFSALVTNMTLPAVEISNFYDARGECENTIKEFKADYGASGFCMRWFQPTQTVLRLISILFNIVAEFKADILGNSSITLATVRSKVFVVGAVLGRKARRTVLRIGLAPRWKETFDALLARIFDTFPTAAQLDPARSTA